MVTVSPPVSPSVVASTLMIQNPIVTAGTFEAISEISNSLASGKLSEPCEQAA